MMHLCKGEDKNTNKKDNAEQNEEYNNKTDTKCHLENVVTPLSLNEHHICKTHFL